MLIEDTFSTVISSITKRRFIRTDVLALESTMFTSTVQTGSESSSGVSLIRPRCAVKRNESNAIQFVILPVCI